MTTIYRPVERNAPYATGADGERAEFWGFLYGVPGQGTYSFDERLDEDIKLNGGFHWCRGAEIGDTVSFSIIDKSQPQEVVLAEYVQEMPLAPWDHQADLTAPTVASLPAGVFLRLTVKHAADTPMVLGVTYKCFVQ